MTIDLGTTARDIARQVQAGESVQDVADALLERIDRYDNHIQAFATVRPDAVRAEATWLDARRDQGARLPLHGVPVGVKDIIDVAGWPTMAGFEPFQNNIADHDAAIVEALRAQGAFVIGKTHTTQFAVGDPAPTRNPWDLEKSPAGSSAGSGAAVAAGMAPVTLGSQTAGSMLRPAAFNGVVGFKPTFGWFPLDGVLPLCWSLDHLGIYAEDVSDVFLVYDAITGNIGKPVAYPSATPRIGLLTEFLEMSSPDVASHLRSVAANLSSEGFEVVETSLPKPFELIFAVHQVIFAAEMSALHGSNLDRHRAYYGPRIATAVDAGRLLPAGGLVHAQRLRRALTETFDRFLSTWDALLFPTASTEPCDISETGDRRFQILATLLGLPAISLPTGLSENRLPIATQLIGQRNEDRRLLAMAERITEVISLIGKPDLSRLD
jgi:aspartyl-tRNA(Asn)/glutamyl-tRNA(Gln) amidotransferase subunit A